MAADNNDKASRVISLPVGLPVCRWRRGSAIGHICHSTKHVNSPNIVAASFCASCCYADHEPPGPLPHALPCVHRGPLVKSAVQDRERVRASADAIFACALHGRCTIADEKQLGVRGCDGCGDYLSRDPFGPDSAQMSRQAEKFLRTVPPYPQGRYKGRGVIIAAADAGSFPGLYVTIRALRHLGCCLPIQVWHLGRNRGLRGKRQAALAPFQVECVDADQVRRRHPARRLDDWELKVFATLHCPFAEVLFLDDHCYPCRNPDFLFDLEDYRAEAPFSGLMLTPRTPVSSGLRLAWPVRGGSAPWTATSSCSTKRGCGSRSTWPGSTTRTPSITIVIARETSTRWKSLGLTALAPSSCGSPNLVASMSDVCRTALIFCRCS